MFARQVFSFKCSVFVLIWLCHSLAIASTFGIRSFRSPASRRIFIEDHQGKFHSDNVVSLNRRMESLTTCDKWNGQQFPSSFGRRENITNEQHSQKNRQKKWGGKKWKTPIEMNTTMVNLPSIHPLIRPSMCPESNEEWINRQANLPELSSGITNINIKIEHYSVNNLWMYVILYFCNWKTLNKTRKTSRPTLVYFCST